MLKEITDSFGTTVELAEKDFDTFTALAGSRLAYIALFIEALSKLVSKIAQVSKLL